MNVHKMERFVGSNGESVDRLSLVDSETGLAASGEDSLLFIGTGRVGFTFSDPAGRPVQDVQQVQFPIEASSLTEAFEKFESSLEKFMEHAMEEENKPKVVVPGDLMDDHDGPNIIM